MEINNSEKYKEENSNNQEEKQSKISVEGNQSQSQNIPKSKEEKAILKKESNKVTINKKESSKEQKQKKFVKLKMNKKTKSNVNPFIMEDNNEHRHSKQFSKHGVNKYSIRSSYLAHYKNEISDLKEQNPNKSAFSKISEIM